MNGLRSLLCIALSTVSLSAVAAGPVSFVGSVWEGGGVGLRFDEHIPLGQKRTMQLPGRQVIEMSVDANGGSTVRLLDREGKELHSSVSPADGPNPRVFRYAFCRKGRVAFTSPPEGDRSGCT